MPPSKYRLFRRASGVFYQQDNATGAQVSLRTKEKRAAQELMRAANEAVRQPRLNLALARIYLQAHDVEMTRCTWREVMYARVARGSHTFGSAPRSWGDNVSIPGGDELGQGGGHHVCQRGRRRGVILAQRPTQP